MNKENAKIISELRKIFGVSNYTDDEDFITSLSTGVQYDFEGFENWDNLNEHLDKVGYELVYEKGGGEGGTEHVEAIFKVGEKYYLTSWSYFSYEGYNFEGIEDTICEVRPVQKTITVYE